MTARTAIGCWRLPVALGVAALLSRGAIAARDQTQKAVDQPAYAAAWSQQVTARDAPKIAVGPASLALAFARDPLQVRAVKDGHLMWSAPMPSDLTPAVGDGLVFVVSGSRLQALDELTGQPRWAVDLGTSSLGPTWRPGWILVAAGRELRAYRSTDGSLGWRADVGAPIIEPAVVDGNLVLVATDEPGLAALDGVGSRQWHVRLDARAGPLAAAGGFVYFGASDRSLRAHREVDGRAAWTFEHMELVGAPVADDRQVFVALYTNEVRGLDRRTGNLRQRQPLDGRPAPGLTLTGADVLVPLNNGDFVVLAARDLTRQAHVRSPAPRDTFESAAISADGARVYTVLVAVSGERTLTAFDRRTAKPAR